MANCETCGKLLEYRGVGRPRRFCGEGCYAEARRKRRRRVPRYIYDAELKRTVPNPDPRPKSTVR